jgi:hypothetical protein
VSFTLRGVPAGIVTSRSVGFSGAAGCAGAAAAIAGAVAAAAGAGVAVAAGSLADAAAAGWAVEVAFAADCAGPFCEHAVKNNASAKHIVDLNAMFLPRGSSLGARDSLLY